MKNPHIIWASVVIVLFLIAGTVTLSALGKPTQTVIDIAILVGLPVLSALGVGAYQNISNSMDQVKNQSNGRLTEMTDMVKTLHEQVTQLALMVPTTSRELEETDRADRKALEK